MGLTVDVWHQNYENKKEGLQNYLEYSFYSILNIFYRSGYRALDPEFGQNRIRNTDFNRICFRYQEHASCAFPAMEDIRRQGKLCDVNLVIGNRDNILTEFMLVELSTDDFV